MRLEFRSWKHDGIVRAPEIEWNLLQLERWSDGLLTVWWPEHGSKFLFIRRVI